MDTQSTALAVAPFEEMERADEQMVLDEIKGRAMDALVYQIDQRGQTITGLSLSGVRETARVMNANGKARIAIAEHAPIITETPDYFEVSVYAVDALNGGGYWGVKRQPKFYIDKRGKRAENAFALEQALAKAQRNAIRGLIPEWFVKEMIEAWKQDSGKVKTVNAAKPAAASDNGKAKPLMLRPYPAEYFKKALSIYAASIRNPEMISDGRRGILVNRLEQYTGGPEKRHELLEYLTGSASIKEQPAATVMALERLVNNRDVDEKIIRQEIENCLVAQEELEMHRADQEKTEG